MQQRDTHVTILGGGLAGMSLALQLKYKRPNIGVTVIEKNIYPVNDTTAKVGESTVEIAAHYFGDVLGLRSHFEQYHLRKHGLRLFFGSRSDEFSEYDELGVSELFGIPTYQIERGVLENYLHSRLMDLGVDFISGAMLQNISVGTRTHSVIVSLAESEVCYTSRWLIDASGRTGLLKRKLNLAKDNAHRGNAVFFRVDKTVIIDDWSGNSDWRDQIRDKGKRWLSTNHLMGPGYWVWIIPLGSGATSFGIVMDDKALSESAITSFDDTVKWLRENHPQCAASLDGANLLDFVVIKNYSYDCKQVFSADGWALSGEAGTFADPFYSPGSDYIAISNTFITQLIADEFDGKSIELKTVIFQKLYDSFYQNTLLLYKDLYGGFGDRRMMAVKLVWDYSYYWGVLALLFYADVITDIEKMRDLNPILMRAQKANKRMHKAMRQRAERRLILPKKSLFMDQYLVPLLRELNAVLKQPQIDVATSLGTNVEKMERMVPMFEQMLGDISAESYGDIESSIIGDYRGYVMA